MADTKMENTDIVFRLRIFLRGAVKQIIDNRNG
jgi:hypothetical protein